MKDDKFGNGNPYSAPVEGSVRGPMPSGANGTYVRQVKPLCICMTIQGVLEVLVGIGFAAMALVMPAVMLNQPGPGGAPAIQPEQQEFIRMIFWLTYGGGGLLTVIAGVVRIVAGVRGLYFRGYALGTTSHFLGLLSLMSCYCLPTAIGLCIWGSIVYFNSEVKQAFQLGAQGHDPEEIEARMSGRHPR